MTPFMTLLLRDFNDTTAKAIDAKYDELAAMYVNRNKYTNEILMIALYALNIYHVNTPDGEMNTVQWANDFYARYLNV